MDKDRKISFLIDVIVYLTKENSSLREEARIDHLTGLGNRKYFEEKMAEIQALIDREELASKFICVASIDVDKLGEINKLYAETVGDRALQAIAKKLFNSKRPYDITCRVGGDEFRVIAIFSKKTDTMVFENRLKKRLKEVAIDGVHLNVSATVSFNSQFVTKETKIDELNRFANLVMYDIKAGGQ